MRFQGLVVGRGVAKSLPLKLDDVKGRAVCEVGTGIRITRERCGVGPNSRFEIVLRILATRRKGIPVQTVAGSKNCFRINRPCNADARANVVFNRRRREEFCSCNYDVIEVRIILERVRYARSSLRHTAKRRHLSRADGPSLIREIE